MAEEKNIIYTAEDIEQYLADRLTPAQMHALERAALDDEFLAEAIEGYQEFKNKDWQTNLKNAHRKITEPVEKEEAKLVVFRKTKIMWWRAAAVLLLLAGTVITFKLLNKPEIVESTEIAALPKSMEEAPVSNTTLPEQKSVSTNPPIEGKQKTDADKPAKLETNPNPTSSNPIGGVVADSKTKPGENNDMAAKQEVITNAPASVAVSQNAEVAKAKEAIVAYDYNADSKNQSRSKAAKANRYNFLSQVVGADNTPVPFANISVKTENFGTYTDVNGNFRFPSNDSMVTVQVKSVGYLPKTYTLYANSNNNKIILTEDKIDASKREVVKKSNIQTKSRKVTFVKDNIVDVEPADGWENYGRYVSNNIDIPDEILTDKSNRREVEVSFIVAANGSITDIKVDKSACGNCDENAVRKLIEEGPQWKLKKGTTGAAKIKLRF